MKKSESQPLTTKDYSLQSVSIKNRREGLVYIPKYLFEKWSLIDEKKGGETQISKISSGRAYRGFKHLYETIQKKGEKLVLSDEASKRSNGYCWINMKEYQSKGQSVFLGLYREVGLEVASGYLHHSFPDKYEGFNKKHNQSYSSEDLKNIIEKSSGVSSKEKTVIKGTTQLLEKNNTNNNFDSLNKKTKEIEELQKQSTVSLYITRVETFKDRLQDLTRYKETSGKDHRQGWLVENSRIFGNLYKKPIEKTKINISGQMPDYLFPTFTGFVDLIEIKRPSHEVIKFDENHNCYRWSDDANKAIGQVLHYLNEIDRNFYALKSNCENLGISFVKPRGFIVIGVDAEWASNKKEGFRLLNSGLNNIEVITYTELIRRGENIIDLYKS